MSFSLILVLGLDGLVLRGAGGGGYIRFINMPSNYGVSRWVQLPFDFDSTDVRLLFDRRRPTLRLGCCAAA